MFNLVAIRTLDLFDFGWFSAAFIAVIVASGLINGYHTESRISMLGDQVATYRPALLRTLVRVGLAGSAAGLALGLVLLAIGAPLSALGLAFLLPAVAAQDSLRQHLVASRRALAPLAGEGAWLVIQVLGLLLLNGYWLRAWGAYAAGMVLSMAVAATAIPKPGPDTEPERLPSGHRRLRRDLAVEYGMTAGVSQLSVLFLGWGGDIRQVGLARAAFVAFGPLNTLVAGARVVFIPDANRVAQENPRMLSKVTDRTIALVLIFVVVFSALVGGIRPVVDLLFGDAGEQVRELVYYVGYARFGTLAIVAPLIALRGLERSDLSKRARIVTSSILLIGGMVAGLLLAPKGFLVVLGTGSLVGLWYWRKMLESAIRQVGST